MSGIVLFLDRLRCIGESNTTGRRKTGSGKGFLWGINQTRQVCAIIKCRHAEPLTSEVSCIAGSWWLAQALVGFDGTQPRVEPAAQGPATARKSCRQQGPNMPSFSRQEGPTQTAFGLFCSGCNYVMGNSSVQA
jgi:hypothetical protein